MKCIKFTSALFLAAIFPLCSHAASFDCAKAASSTEKLICSNPSVSLLDEQLGQTYKQALASASDKDSLKRQQVEWLKQQRACKDVECLTQTYQARIAQLQKGEAVIASTQPTQAAPATTKTGAKKVSFKITEGQGEPLCEEYLKVLNRTAWDDLQACKLPDLKSSPIQAVDFKPLSGDVLKTLDKLVYERSTHKKDWDTIWSTRQHEYEIGYRKLGEAFWDLDGDGKDDQIIEHQEPGMFCESYGDGKSDSEGKLLEARWGKKDAGEKLSSALQNGFKRYFYSIKQGNIFSIPSGIFVEFDQKKYFINSSSLKVKNTSTEWAGKDWVYISSVKSQPNIENGIYSQTPTICKFWLK